MAQNQKLMELNINMNNLKELNCNITIDEVNNAIRSIGIWKAMGPDDIHNYMLKYYGNMISKTLLYLFNWSYNIGYFPKIWKKCNITPILKPGRNSLYCKNWRPISLLSCTGKLLERVIATRLLYYCRINKLITPNQAGFQQKLKTEDLLLRLTENAYEAIKNQSVLYTVLLDISSAYDCVWRKGLLYKLRQDFKLKGKIYWLLDSYLKDRLGRVVINGIKSNWKEYRIGVPQGSCLSPLLFIIYINNIGKNIDKQVNIGQFADDICLWISPHNKNIKDMEISQNKLQNAINSINNWCNTWKMSLSPNKQNILYLNTQTRRNIQIKY